MPYTFDSMHGPGVSGASTASFASPVTTYSSDRDKVIEAVGNPYPYNVNSQAVKAAKEIDDFTHFDSSDFGDQLREILGDYSSSAQQYMQKYVDQIIEQANLNTEKSQSFAREQMEYQKASDAAAMAWSAAEAQKNRDYQERLANTAHQREVKDLLAAGLNPILSANAGAYTGSGATGQGFSSSGAQGTVDTSGAVGLGSLASSIMNSASNAMSAKLYTDTSKYQTDMQYAMTKMQTEASLLMNDKNIDANKAINKLNNENAIRSADIYSSATLGAAGMSAGATEYAAQQAALASMYGSDQTYKWQTENSRRSAFTSASNSQRETGARIEEALIRNEASPFGLLAELAKTMFDNNGNSKSNTIYDKAKEAYNAVKNNRELDAVSGASPSVPFGPNSPVTKFFKGEYKDRKTKGFGHN